MNSVTYVELSNRIKKLVVWEEFSLLDSKHLTGLKVPSKPFNGVYRKGAKGV